MGRNKDDSYTPDEVKQIFREYREIKHSRLTDDEFDIFCRALCILPKEIVDSLHNAVEFVLLSAHHQNAAEQACMLPFDDELKKKKALIIITPIIFGYRTDWSNREDDRRWAILHEVAHFHLGTRPYESPEDFERKEKEADELVQKWLDDFCNE